MACQKDCGGILLSRQPSPSLCDAPFQFRFQTAVQSEALCEILLSLRLPAQQQPDDAAIDPGVGEVGIEFEGLTVIRDCTLGLSQAQPRIATIIPGWRE